MSKIKERLKELRLEKDVTQRAVASAIGITLSAYSNYEQGLREPCLDIIIKLCKYYKTSADYLIGLSD